LFYFITPGNSAGGRPDLSGSPVSGKVDKALGILKVTSWKLAFLIEALFYLVIPSKLTGVHPD
jgi:hypothetical protein